MANLRVVCIAMLLAVMAGLTGASRAHMSKAPQPFGRSHDRHYFCGELDCPDFKVLDDRLGNRVELRRYYPSTWAITRVNQRFYEAATSAGFRRLFGYIVGYNELQTKIEMTTPVVTSIRIDKDGDFKESFGVAFFLPYKYQPHCDRGAEQTECDLDSVGRRKRDEEVPIPRDERVKIRDFGTFAAYVLPFDGYALGFRVKELVFGFFDYLERQGEKGFIRDYFLVAVYDAPFKVFDRHNEIWVLKRRCKDEGVSECPEEDAADPCGGFDIDDDLPDDDDDTGSDDAGDIDGGDDDQTNTATA